MSLKLLGKKYVIILPKLVKAGTKLGNEIAHFNGVDVLFTVLLFLFIAGIFVAVLLIILSRLTKQQQSNKSKDVEQKLDRIIELLEQDKK